MTTATEACTLSASEPIGTTSTEALACNSSTLDTLINSTNTPSAINRVGNPLRTFSSIYTELDEILDNSQGVPLGDGVYAVGRTYTTRYQYLTQNNIEYRVAGTTPLPYITVEVNASDDPNLAPFTGVSNLRLTSAVEKVLRAGANIFPDQIDMNAVDGDIVPIGTTHLQVNINSSPEIVMITPSTTSAGVIASLTETGCTIGGVSTTFSLIGYDSTGAINAASLGVNTGLVNVSTFKAALAFAVSQGKDLYVPAGDYNFNGQDITNGSLVNGGDVGSYRVVGDFRETIFRNIASTNYSGYIKSVGIKYLDCLQPIYMTGNCQDLDIRLNEFEGVRRAIYHNDTTAGVSIKRGEVAWNYFHTHTENDFVGAVLFNRAPAIEDVDIHHNYAEDIQAESTGTNIFAGWMIGNEDGVIDDFQRNKVRHNTIINCGNARDEFANPSFGSVIFGLDSIQLDNTLRNGQWLEPLYMRGNGNQQINNKCHANEHSGVSMKLISGTRESRLNLQDGNVVTGRCDIRPGIRLFGDGLSINSQIDITASNRVISQGGLPFQATPSSTIDGKLKITGQFKGPKGIQITTAGDLELDISLKSDTNGLIITKSTDGNLGKVVVKGDISCTTQALNVNWCERFDGSQLNIVSNYIGGDQVFIYARDSLVLDGGSLHITDTNNDGMVLGTAIALNARDGGDATQNNNISFSNFNITTDRVITNIIRYNADAGLVTPNKGKLKISDIEVDMRGHTGSNLVRTTSGMKKLSLNGVEVDGTLVSTLSGAGQTVDKLLINENLLDYVTTDNLAGHTNVTATASRIGNNITT